MCGSLGLLWPQLVGGFCPFILARVHSEPLGWHFLEGNERKWGKPVLVCPVSLQPGQWGWPHPRWSHCCAFRRMFVRERRTLWGLSLSHLAVL